MLAAPPPTAAPISAPFVPPIAPPTPAPAAADPPIIRAVFVFERSGSRSYSALTRRALERDVRYAAGRAWLRPSAHWAAYLPLPCAALTAGTASVPNVARLTTIRIRTVFRNIAPLPVAGGRPAVGLAQTSLRRDVASGTRWVKEDASPSRALRATEQAD